VARIPDELCRRRRLFVVGDCAHEHRRRGTFVPGCPPSPMALTYAFLLRGIHGPLETRLRDLARGTLGHVQHLVESRLRSFGAVAATIR